MKTRIARLLVVGLCLTSSGCRSVGSAVPLPAGDPARGADPTIAIDSRGSAYLDSGPDERQNWSRLIKEGREHLLLGRFNMAEQSLVAAFMIAKHFRSTDVRRRVSFGNLEQLAERYRTAQYYAAATRVLKIIAIESSGQTELEYAGLSDLMLDLGDLQQHDGSLEAAEVSYQRALDLRIEKSGQDSASLITVYQKLTGLEIRRERLDHAVRYAERSLELTEFHLGQSTPETVRARLQAGAVYLKREQYPEAATQYQRALKTQRALEPSSVTEAATLNAIANVYLRMNRLDEALESIDLALSILKSRNLVGLDQAFVLDTKAQILAARGEIESAARLFSEVMAQASAAPPAEARMLFESYESFLRDQDRTSEARKIREQIDRIDQINIEQSNIVSEEQQPGTIEALRDPLPESAAVVDVASPQAEVYVEPES